MPLRGGPPVLLSRHPAKYPAISPDGGPEVQITRFAAEPLTGFDWSPDGRTLACLRGGWHGDAYLVRGDW